MKKVTASAPGKLMLIGEHSVVYGHPCIVTAVNQRLTVIVGENGKNIFSIDAPDLGLHAYSKTIEDLGKKPPKSVRFIETLYKNFLDKYPQSKSIHVTTKSDFSHQFGFGSSSAVTVAFAKAVTTFYGIKLSNKELFDLCYQAVIDVQGVGSGFDLAAAIWGGTIYYVPPAEVVEEIKIEDLPLVVAYTGVKADTPTLIRMVQKIREDNPERTNHIFDQITMLVEAGRKSLEEKDWTKLAEIFQKNQILLRKLQVSSIELEKLIFAAHSKGAVGAKLSGAGGGDCVIVVVDKGNKELVVEEISKADGLEMKVELNAPGVRIEK
jgi:mevalonate kinase